MTGPDDNELLINPMSGMVMQGGFSGQDDCGNDYYENDHCSSGTGTDWNNDTDPWNEY